MSNVTLQIGGKSYPVACADGEEAHIAKLGAMIDAKFKQMGDNLAPQEVQNFLFASLILADEVHEAQGKPSSAAPAPTPDGDEDQGETAELRTEIEELTQSAATLTEERDALTKELEQAKADAVAKADALTQAEALAETKVQEAAQAAEDDQQQEMFGEDVLATRLEELASRAESFAEALEANGA